jgi:hypothetical protein
MRRLLVLLLLVGVAAGIAAAIVLHERGSGKLPEDAVPGHLLVGFEDEPSLRWDADRTSMVARARQAGARVIRTTVFWMQAAPRRPADPTNPFDPAYRLSDVDELDRLAKAHGIELLLTIWGTPTWANGGLKPNHPPLDAGDLGDFAQALAARYSGRHAGFPRVRLFSIWNEPNLEQFLAPQFDDAGNSVSPQAYARLVNAGYAGIKRADPDALVAIGETSAHGQDAPSRDRIQDSHSPGRFAHLLAEVRPKIHFDAWAQHPYPTRPGRPPDAHVHWPGMGLSSIGRFGDALDDWFGRSNIPLWLTEYGHETRPEDPFGVSRSTQARFAREALSLAADDSRVRMFVWFVLRDTPGNPWQSGLIDDTGQPKPALAAFSREARRVDP